MRPHQNKLEKKISVKGIVFLTLLIICLLLSILLIQSSPVAVLPPTTTLTSSIPSATLIPPATKEPTEGIEATAATTQTPTRSPLTTSTVATLIQDENQLATPIPLGGKEISRFTFAVCGDNRGGDEIYSEILRFVQYDDVTFLVNTGDLVHWGDADQFQHFAELMDGFSLPFFPVAGNHDAADGLLDEYLRYSGAPDVHYSFDYGLGHFVIVDSHHGVLQNRELEWLEADLAATDQPLKIVFLHHPPFDPDGTDHILEAGNQRFMNLMEKFDVSHVFAGHIHAYVEGERNGVQYIITGGGGAELYPGGHPLAFYHYIRVTIDGSEVSTEIIRITP